MSSKQQQRGVHQHSSSPAVLTSRERFERIQERAYFIAEESGFTRPEDACWHEAEKEILLSSIVQFDVEHVKTTPYTDQKTGTSGLRKKVSGDDESMASSAPTDSPRQVTVFQQPSYVENWLQSLFDAVPELRGGTLVLGGDGRYHNAHCLQLALRMAAANGVRRVLVGANGLFSTPAVSAAIRARGAAGGIIFTASHNAGGAHADMGVKFNVASGGPASEAVTDRIFAATQRIAAYKIAAASAMPAVSLEETGVVYRFQASGDGGAPFAVEVIDSVEDWLALMRDIFPFDRIGRFLVHTPAFKMRYDALHGVGGPYARALFGALAAAGGGDARAFVDDVCVHCVPLEDFGGGHPDPNLTYARALVDAMRADASLQMGAASDGDADRNMILGRRAFFVNPSDSVAVVAAHARLLPYYARDLTCVARSMPTSQALDRVAAALKLRFLEVPTGWKYFGNAMDHFEAAGKPHAVICGEESFGTGSSHVREKDGLWAVLFWLFILTHANEQAAAAASSSSSSLVRIEDVMRAHWRTYGRNFFSRYDYEEVAAADAERLMTALRALAAAAKPGACVPASDAAACVTVADDFAFTDAFDGSRATRQGVRVVYEDGARFVVRLSGTGASGATVRIYVERYVPPSAGDAALFEDAATALAPLIRRALDATQLAKFTGRTEPTVIT